MIACKAFNPGLVCLGYQFVMGKNVTDKANCRQNGFHCAEDPLDCLSYYSDIHRAVFCLVDAGGDINEDDCDSKISCTELTILKELTLDEYFLYSLAFMTDHPKRQWSCHVHHDKAAACCGYAVVRGIDPVASGKIGDYLAFAKESVDRSHIEQIALVRVDGESILPDVWYDVNLNERNEIL